MIISITDNYYTYILLYIMYDFRADPRAYLNKACNSRPSPSPLFFFNFSFMLLLIKMLFYFVWKFFIDNSSWDKCFLKLNHLLLQTNVWTMIYLLLFFNYRYIVKNKKLISCFYTNLITPLSITVCIQYNWLTDYELSMFVKL